jgi:hypothetical protein
MAILTAKDLDKLEKLYEDRRSYGQWGFEDLGWEGTVHLTSWDKDTPVLDDEDDMTISEIELLKPDMLCVATLGYNEDMKLIAHLHNAFPALLEMARELLNVKRLLVETCIFDAFSYADPSHWVGEQTLHTAMQHYSDAGLKEEHWVDHVYNVLNDTCHPMFEEADDETDPGERYIAVLNAWCGDTDFPTTFQEIKDIQPN